MIAIKDMEMPKCCIQCPVFDGEYGLCNIIGDEPEADLAKERPEDCPLVEIVTCKDCKHREKVHPHWYFCTLQSDEYCYEVEDDDFCADGERRE